VAAGITLALSTIAATPVGRTIGSALGQRFGFMVVANTSDTNQPNSCEFRVVSGKPLTPNTTITTFTRNGVTITEITRKCKNGTSITGWGVPVSSFDLQQAQSRVTFRIRSASWLPPGMKLKSVGMTLKPPDFSRYGDNVMVEYGTVGNRPGPGLRISEEPGTPFGGSAVPSSAAHAVRVNGHPAVYARGNWVSNATLTARRWDPTKDQEELSWQADGITYDMLGSHLSKAEMIRIAESVR
jgi:hypothetical protein